jgi:hypothetical protein
METNQNMAQRKSPEPQKQVQSYSYVVIRRGGADDGNRTRVFSLGS